MNLDMAVRAVRVLRIQVMLRTGRLIRSHTVSHAVTGQTELCDAARDQQARIRRTVRRMTSDAAFRLYWSMLVNERSLLVCVTLYAGCVRAGGEPCLLELKAAVGIVAIAAFHCAFQHLVMERQIKLMLGFAVTTEAKLRFAGLEQFQVCDTGLLCVGTGDKHVRCRELSSARRRMARVAVSTTDVVAPVFAATKVVVFLSACVTAQTCFRSFLGRLVLKRNDLLRVTFFDVGFPWTMA